MLKNKIFFNQFAPPKEYFIDLIYKYCYNTIVEKRQDRKEEKTMKSVVFKRKSKSVKWRIMQIPIVLLLTVICIFSVFISASAENAIRVENCNLCESYSQKLGEEINGFILLDTEPNKTISTQVTLAINEYRKEIFDLQSHPDVEKRSLKDDVLLAYAKGNSAGRLAWVYYYNIYTFKSETSISKINAKYASFKDSIAKSTQSSVLFAECEVMLDELNRLIFTERAKNLAVTGDSLTSSALISGVVEEFKVTHSSDIFGAEYQKIYDELVDELGLQRVRDALTAEGKRIFAQITSKKSFDSSPTAALLVYNLKSAENIKKMNVAALDFCKELLAIDEKKPYSASLKQSLLFLAEDACARATESSDAVNFGTVFEGYQAKLKKSEIKDSIYLLLLGANGNGNDELIKLEQKYNAENGIIDKCANDQEVDSALVSAKAELFLLENKAIAEKPFSELSSDDEAIAKKALTEYASLEDKVKTRLLSDINIIAEKYNYILIAKMRSLMTDDALYLDFCENISSELKNIPRDNIEDFYNKASRIFEKAQALSKVISEYRSILSEENYTGYTEEERKALISTLDKFSAELSTIDPKDIAIYSDEISNATATAIRALNVTDQCARVRIATRNSDNPLIAEELKIAIERIGACAEKSEMIIQASRAIYKIQRLLTADAILKDCEELKSAIEKSEFLTADEKQSFIASVARLAERSNNAKEAENITALEEICSSFSSSLSKIRSEAEAIDLARAISSYLEKVEASHISLVEKLDKLEYISKDISVEIYNRASSLKNEASDSIPLLKSSEEVVSYYENFLINLNKILKDAEIADLEGYKLYLLSKFDEYEQIKSNYSTENYNKILELKASAKESLNTATSKGECDRIINEALNAVLLINDLLDDEKDEALASLLALLNELKKNSPLYSPKSFSTIEGLYDESKLEIGKISGIENIATVKQTLAKYLTLMSAVRRDRVYTSAAAYDISTPSLRYPDGYDFSKGILGSVYLPDGIMSDADLYIKLVSRSGSASVEKLIRSAAKNNKLRLYEPVSDETRKLLRSAAVAMTLDIGLTSVYSEASGYKLQMLIPNELADENILGLAFVNGETVEFYPVTRKDQLINVELEHFSSYYVVVESTLNVKPLLIVLIVLLILEFAVLIALLYLRHKRNGEETQNKEKTNLPDLPMSAIIPIAPLLTRVYPENGVALAILLTIAVVALAATIALLIKNEAKRPKENEQKLLKGKREQLLLENKPQALLGEDAFFEPFDNELCKVGAKAKTQSVRAEIDLDLIADNFNSNEKVSIESLKNKGLIDENAEHIRIFTKGNLVKPLRIEADEFSNAAKEVIKLSGGEVIEK